VYANTETHKNFYFHSMNYSDIHFYHNHLFNKNHYQLFICHPLQLQNAIIAKIHFCLHHKLFYSNHHRHYICHLLQLRNAIIAEIKEHNLMVNEHSITKVIQLYETKTSRHSVMIVGGTQSAKTTTWRVLQGSMTALNKNPETSSVYQAVKVGNLIHL